MRGLKYIFTIVFATVALSGFAQNNEGSGVTIEMPAHVADKVYEKPATSAKSPATPEAATDKGKKAQKGGAAVVKKGGGHNDGVSRRGRNGEKISMNTGNKFTVQVFQGKTSRKALAEARAQRVKTRYPGVKVRVRTRSPYCYVWVGEFATRYEAEVFMKKLKDSFKNYAEGMMITTVR